MIVTPEDFAVLFEACNALDAAGIPYVIGGGTVVVLYGRERRTKDFDLFLNREVLLPAMNVLSLTDFTTTDTEKSWLFKAWRGETLVDLIVESRGGIRVDSETLNRARWIEQHGFRFRVMGPEDTLFRKALSFTEGRPDWHDGLSILLRQREQLDWHYLLYRAQAHPRRILSFLLFAQTELHRPHGGPSNEQGDILYSGQAPGPVPDWVVLALHRYLTTGEMASPYNPHRIRYLPKAA
jgi:predicted nucleotidyltransferase